MRLCTELEARPALVYYYYKQKIAGRRTIRSVTRGYGKKLFEKTLIAATYPKIMEIGKEVAFLQFQHKKKKRKKTMVIEIK